MTALHNEIICFQNGRVVAIQNVDNWTLEQTNEAMVLEQDLHPERECIFKRRQKLVNERQSNETSK